MLYTKLTIAAMCLAYNAHHGQVDKGGVPYIFHPFHLAEQMEDEVSCTAALLHDVVEDTDITMEQLAEQFPAEVIDVLRLLTHEEGVPYMDYLARLAPNPVARRIKLADIAHNDCEERAKFGNPPMTAEKREYFRKKYAKAREFLLSFEK